MHYRLDKDNKVAKFIQKDDGSLEEIKFFVENFENFNNDPNEYFEHVESRRKLYENFGKTHGKGEPNPYAYEGDSYSEDYQADLKRYDANENETRMARAFSKVLYARDEANKPPPPPPEAWPLGYRLIREGTAKDKARFSAISQEQKFMMEQAEKAAEHRALGNIRAALECEERAAMTQRALKREMKTPFDLVASENKKDLDWAKGQLKEIMSMPAKEQGEYIKNHSQEINNLCQSWRDLASDDSDSDHRVAYLIDSGDNPYSKHRGPPRIVEIETGDYSAKNFVTLAGSTENDPLIRTAYETGKIESYDDGLPGPEGEGQEGESFSQEAWEQSLQPVQK